jgi:transcriptional antiterminator RfaH
MIFDIPSEAPSDESGWYVVYARPRQETRAMENLGNQGFKCFLPTIRVERLRGGHRAMISEALFPRYLFVYLEAGRSNWSAIRSTRGVSHLVRFGGIAVRLHSSLIDALTEQPSRNKALFDAGDQLKVIDGPFIGFEAEVLRLYEAPDGEARVMVLMDILTRPQKISLPASAVRKAA